MLGWRGMVGRSSSGLGWPAVCRVSYRGSLQSDRYGWLLPGICPVVPVRPLPIALVVARFLIVSGWCPVVVIIIVIRLTCPLSGLARWWGRSGYPLELLSFPFFQFCRLFDQVVLCLLHVSVVLSFFCG